MSRSINHLSRRGALGAGILGAGLLGVPALGATREEKGGGGAGAGAKLRICVDRRLPPEREEAGLRAAVKEDPSNDFLGALKKMGAKAPPITGTPQGVGFYGKKWSQNKVLKVKFLEGERSVQQKVRKHALKWYGVVNIGFDFVESGPAEIRITFNPQDGSWSYVGTDNLIIPQNRPTMNFGWLAPDSSEEEYSSVVLHEFGHALFMGHEHQSPAAGKIIDWDREQVIKDCWEKLGWSAQQVNEQILTRYDKKLTVHTEPDVKSIMMYPFPAHWNKKGIGTPWNTALSDLDIEFMKKHYPKG
jgi:hypothetical protein